MLPALPHRPGMPKNYWLQLWPHVPKPRTNAAGPCLENSVARMGLPIQYRFQCQCWLCLFHIFTGQGMHQPQWHHTCQPLGTYINYKGGSVGGDPTATFLVQTLLSACHKLSKQFDLRMPIDKPMLSRLLGALEFTVPGKYHRALYKAMVCLAFHAFLRIGEMAVQSSNATNPNLLQ